MTILRFDEGALLDAIERLPPPARAAFAAACAERLLPAYVRFARRTEKGNPVALTDILAGLWADLTGSPMSDTEVDASVEMCMQLIPQEDDGPWVPEQAAAEDAASALAYALRCRRTGSSREAAWAARCAYEAIDHYVVNHEKVDTNIPGAEARVLAHPIIQSELARQQRDLSELHGSTISANGLRERSKAEASVFLP